MRMVQMQFDGYSNRDIAASFGMTESAVSQILSSEPVQQYLELIKNHHIDTTMEVRAKVQSAAPLIMDQLIDTAINGSDERVKVNAGRAVLGIGGHVPIKRHEITHSDPISDKYDKLSKEEILQQIRDDIENVPDRTSLHDGKTIH